LLKKWDGNMEESEIKIKIKEKFNIEDNNELEEIFQILKENNEVPKSEKEVNELFNEIEELKKINTIDDSEFDEE
jgi:hypothetical protein